MGGVCGTPDQCLQQHPRPGLLSPCRAPVWVVVLNYDSAASAAQQLAAQQVVTADELRELRAAGQLQVGWVGCARCGCSLSVAAQGAA